MASRKCAQAGRQNGYALVAAMLIMIMITALGVVAMVTSSSEQRITSNLGESQMMFYHAEQAVDRILSHLTYLQGGMFSVVNGLGYDPAQSGNILSPKQVLSSKSVLYKSSAGTLDPSALYKIDAWFDPLDFNSPLANTISFWSRPAAITVRVTDSRSGSQRAFRFYVQPRSPWDFAYYVQNNVPADRKTSSLAGENCGATSPNWYSCQTALMTRDQVTGDAYVGNVVMTPAGVTEAFPDTGTLFVRGWPVFAGEARWRSPVPFDEGTFNGAAFVNSLNQTRGGSATSYQPKGKGGMKAYSKPVTMPNIGQTFTDYYNSADYVFDDPTQGGCVGCVWKILFRNDLDTHNDVAGGFPNRGNSRVASAYTGSTNRASGQTNGDPDPANWNRGQMMIYRLPFYNAADPNDEQTKQWAAFYGDSMMRRDAQMILYGGERGRNGGPVDARISGGNTKCWYTRQNQVGTFTYAPYDPEDIAPSYDFMLVPSQGLPNPCAGGTYKGIMFFKGDVLVSGVLAGQVTIVSTGNIILDHEVQYETNPGTPVNLFTNPLHADILGLIAAGNVVIPNSVPQKWATDVRKVYQDDWSDAFCNNEDCVGVAALFTPTGFKDHPRILDDQGAETIDAVIMTYGFSGCAMSGSALTGCTSPSTSDVQNFFTGFYATPRTYRADFPTRARYYDIPFDYETGPWNTSGGNDSGPLTIIGAVMQNIPGRLAYDYYHAGDAWSSTCTSGDGCNRIGFSNVNFQWDIRMANIMPPYPRQVSVNRAVPYGGASWDIVSWEELQALDSQLSAAVW